MRKNIKFYPYIDDIAYNEFELKEEVWYGNGTHVHYAYDTLQRLDTLRSYDGLDSLMQDIHYTYDSVGNITDIENYAPVLPNGLGGPYSHHHDYDSFYRIEHSEGWWGQTPLSYTLDMEYHDNGRIQRKTLSSDTWLEGVLASMNYDNAYHYTNPLQPNTLAYIGNGPQQTFEWDAKRNLTYHWNDMTRLKRYLGWDEENRLTSYSKGNTRVFYRYDAQGERFYKNTGNTTAYGNPTLYASPYLVATQNDYTKHYYIEDERFACRIGDGAFPDIDSAVVSNALLSAKQLEVNDAALDSVVPNQFDFLRTRQGQWSSQHTTYWQHSDHLGSASWITDTAGRAIQHLQYMPWGEPLLDYRNSSFNTRYTFSGKERDEETGYSYFGARYYNSTYSIWLSVDPMSDKYPSLSPYVYCGNNPVKLVDVDGEEVYIFGDQQMNAFNSLQKKTKLKISIDKYGKITAEGKATNRDDRKLLKAINSTNARVEIDASKEHTSNDSGGSFMGTSYDADNNTATSCNHINMSIVNKKETNNSDKGSTVMHEITEGFEACKISIRKKCDILPAQKQWRKVVKYVMVESQDAMDNTKTSTSIQRQTYYDWLPVNTKAYRLYLKAHYRATQPMEGY